MLKVLPEVAIAAGLWIKPRRFFWGTPQPNPPEYLEHKGVVDALEPGRMEQFFPVQRFLLRTGRALLAGLLHRGCTLANGLFDCTDWGLHREGGEGARQGRPLSYQAQT